MGVGFTVLVNMVDNVILDSVTEFVMVKELLMTVDFTVVLF